MKKQHKSIKSNKDSLESVSYHSDEELEIRQSPKPTASTHRILKSKSSKSSEFKILARVKSSSNSIQTKPNPQSLYTNEISNPEKINFVINLVMHDNSKVTLRHLEDLNLAEKEDSVQQKSLDVICLFHLRQIMKLRKNIRDAEFNFNLLKDQAQNYEANKKILLQLLLKKLKKKLFMESLKYNLYFNRVKSRFDSLEENSSNISKALPIVQAISHIVNKSRKVNFDILKELTRKIEVSHLYSPISSAKKYQQDNMLQISLSPHVIMNQRVGLGHNQLADTANYIKKLRELLAILYKQIITIGSQYEEPAMKIRRIFLFKWKIRFLEESLKKHINEWRKYQHLKLVFESLKNYKFEEKQTINQQDLKHQKKLLKSHLRGKGVRYGLDRIVQYVNSRKIYKFARMFYETTLKRRILDVFKGFNQQNDQKQTNRKQVIQQRQSEYKESAEQLSMISSRSADQQSNVADIFHNQNLQLKAYSAIKQEYRMRKLQKILDRLSNRFSFRRIIEYSERNTKLQEKIIRFSSRRSKLLQFKYFNRLKNIYESNPLLIKVKGMIERRLQQTTRFHFSVLKLEYKKSLIKHKRANILFKIHKMNLYFHLLKKVTSQQRRLNRKKQLLDSYLILRYWKRFYHNSLQIKLEDLQTKRHMHKIRQQISNFRKTYSLDYLRIIFIEWKKYVQSKKIKKIIIVRYRRLKQKELKRKIFICWFQDCFKKRSLLEISQSNSAQAQSQFESSHKQLYQFQYNNNQNHRLQKYYQNLNNLRN